MTTTPDTIHPPGPSPAEMYESFFGPAIFEPCARPLVEIAAPRRGDAVLDLACGTGQVARRVASLVGEEGSVTALDLSPEMLATGRALPPPEGARIDWREGDAVTLDLPDEVFDLVLCQHGLQFFSDRTGAMDHVHRVLEPGGRVAVAVWGDIERHPVYEAMHEAEARHLEPLGVGSEELLAPFSMGEEEGLIRLLESVGFSSVRVEERSIEARFPGPDTFIRNLQLAYAAVVPEFVRDRSAFDAFVAAVEDECGDLVRGHTEGDHVVVPMHALIATGRAA